MAKATYEEKMATYWQNTAKQDEPNQQHTYRNVEISFKSYLEFQAHQKKKGLEEKLD